MRTDCDDIQQTLGLLLAGELPADEARGIEIHLAACEDCARLRDRFQRLDRLIAAAPVPQPPRDVIQLMALRARATTGRQAVVRRFFAAAAVIVTLLIPAATYFTFAPATTSHVSGSVIDGFGGTFDLDF